MSEDNSSLLAGAISNLSSESPPVVTNTFYEDFSQPLLPYNLPIAGLAILLNCLILAHYIKEYKKFVPSMYILISSCDMLMTITMLLQTILHELSYEKEFEDLHTTSIVILLTVLVSGVSYRCSVFGSLLLSVSRTVQITKPFYRIRKCFVYLSVLLYALVLVCLATYDFVWLLKKERLVYFINFYNQYPTIGMAIEDVLPDQPGPAYRISLLFFILLVPFILPVAIVVICAIIQLLWLKKPTPCGGTSHNHVTITIVILTVVFVICNLPFTVTVNLFQFVMVTGGNQAPYWKKSFQILLSLTRNTLPLVNAALSPVILVARCAALRRSIINTITRRHDLHQAKSRVSAVSRVNRSQLSLSGVTLKLMSARRVYSGPENDEIKELELEVEV